MSLLSLTAVELSQKIESEVARNPALELIEERRCPACHRPLTGAGPCPICSRPQTLSSDQPIVFVSPREDFRPSGSSQAPEDSGDLFPQTPDVEPLPQYVLRQIAPELAPADRAIAAHILTSLDEDGLLSVPIIEIARYQHVPPSRVQSVISLIQRADPIGVASPSPKDALLVQLEILKDLRPVPELAVRAVQEGLDLLSRRRYPELAHLLGISVNQARQVANFIAQNLNPFPARAHWGDTRNNLAQKNPGAYHYPDIIISMLDDENPNSPLVVEIAIPLCGTLRVNPDFKEAIRQVPDEKTQEWKELLEQATLLVKCIQQRNHTIVRLLQQLTTYQREFILHGETFHRPLTRAAMAKVLDVHESTISRAVNEKSVQLPSGHILPLAVFFDRSLHLRAVLKQIIETEREPLSDAQLGIKLEEMGFEIARRTVAKYRSIEGILPAHLRKPVERASMCVSS
jgi:RNA polymerase sigma-54 factor